MKYDDPLEPLGERLMRWLPLVATAMAGVVIALILLLDRAGAEREAALASQARSVEVIDLTRSADAALARAEAAMGRFVVGLDKNQGRLQEREWYTAGELLRRLQVRVADNPIQAAYVSRLLKLYAERGELLGETARSANYRNSLAALSRFYAASRGTDEREIRTLLDDIASQERDRLSARAAAVSATAAEQERLVSLFSALGAIFAVAAAASVYVALRVDTARRQAQIEAEQEAERTTRLEAAVARRTQELATAIEQLKTEAAERAEAEARLRQAQKMEAVGQLTGGIAHDFNNMLAVVIGGIELAARRIGINDADASRHLDQALDGAERASSLTRRLLSFARAEPAMPEGLSPSEAIHNFAELIGGSVGDRIGVTLELDDADWRVRVDRHQFENALLNLAVNARDAMDGSGTLTIASCAGTLDAAEAGILSPGEYVAIAVTDTGCGMTATVMERVFDPFFTTKPVGQGTGLGMSQVFGFARQSGGDVRIESAVGVGTTVTLLLPRYRSDATSDHAPAPPAFPASPATTQGTPLTILVVEDDPRVRDATVDAVEELGHTAVPCGDPAEATDMLAAHPAVSLILSDVLMPGLTGPEMVRDLLVQRPDVAVLFVTGFTGDGAEAGLFDGHDILRKPYTLTALQRAIAGACARQAPLRTDAAA